MVSYPVVLGERSSYYNDRHQTDEGLTRRSHLQHVWPDVGATRNATQGGCRVQEIKETSQKEVGDTCLLSGRPISLQFA